jgi:hypothetical protein
MQLGRTRLSPQEQVHVRRLLRRSRPSPCYMSRADWKHQGSPGQGQTLTSCAVIPRIPSHRLSLPSTLHRDTRQHEIQEFVDSGAADNFIDQDFARELQSPCVKCPIPLQIEALDGRPIGSAQVEYQTKPILLQVGVNHSETLRFLLIVAPENPLILGYP